MASQDIWDSIGALGVRVWGFDQGKKVDLRITKGIKMKLRALRKTETLKAFSFNERASKNFTH